MWLLLEQAKKKNKNRKEHSVSEFCINMEALKRDTLPCFDGARHWEKFLLSPQGAMLSQKWFTGQQRKEQFGKQTWNPISIYIFTNMARLCAYGPWSVRCPLGAQACLFGPGSKQDCHADNWPKKTSLLNNCLFRSAKKCVRSCVSEQKKTHTHKTKKNKLNKKSNKKPTFPFRYVLALSREHICRVFLRGLDWKLNACSSHSLAKSKCSICAYDCAAAQNNFPGARLWVLHRPNSPGKPSPTHPPSTRSASGRCFTAPPPPPLHMIKNTQLRFHVMVSRVSTMSSWRRFEFFYVLPWQAGKILLILFPLSKQAALIQTRCQSSAANSRTQCQPGGDRGGGFCCRRSSCWFFCLRGWFLRLSYTICTLVCTWCALLSCRLLKLDLTGVSRPPLSFTHPGCCSRWAKAWMPPRPLFSNW